MTCIDFEQIEQLVNLFLFRHLILQTSWYALEICVGELKVVLQIVRPNKILAHLAIDRSVGARKFGNRL